MKRITLLFALAAACTTSNSTGIQNVSCPPDSTLTYANFGAEFIGDHCLECHEEDERPLLSTQSQIQANTHDILEQAVYTTEMPEDHGLSIADRQKLGDWIACGAP
jgi:uncharacterized membrane protein